MFVIYIKQVQENDEGIQDKETRQFLVFMDTKNPKVG